jgi:hypothetical protein
MSVASVKRAEAGTVRVSEVRTVIVDVTVEPLYDIHPDTEITLRVNGRRIRRLTHHQADRLGLIRDGEGGHRLPGIDY